MKRILVQLLGVALLLGMVSCSSSEKFALLQNAQTTSESEMAHFEAVLQPDDLLMIVISTENPLVAQPYNLNAIAVTGNTDLAIGQQRLLSYQIDQQGYIQMPNLGPVLAAGKTRNELVNTIQQLLVGKIANPVITVRILNYKVSVQGEVTRPGTFTIATERITLLEALSMAGDLTIYGKRDNILVIREKNGVKSYQKVDITQGDFVNSPYYYLSQNDVVYVEPNKTRVNSSAVGPNISIALSAISLLITIVALTVK